MIRAFVAIDVSPAMRNSLHDVQRKLRSVFDLHASWVRPENFHLTIRFLGGISSDRLATLCCRLQEIRCSPFDLSLSGAGCFPDVRRPIVLWAGLEEEPELIRLANSVESACVDVGMSQEKKPFHAHVTLARVKDRIRNPAAFQQFLSDVHLSDSCPVREMTLYQSILDRQGSMYRKIAGFRFVD